MRPKRSRLRSSSGHKREPWSDDEHPATEPARRSRQVSIRGSKRHAFLCVLTWLGCAGTQGNELGHAGPPTAQAPRLDQVGKECSAESPCARGFVCTEEIIPDLGARHSCQVPCANDDDCEVFTPSASLACVRAFRAKGECQCEAGTPFARCEATAGQSVCSQASFQTYEDVPPCL